MAYPNPFENELDEDDSEWKDIDQESGTSDKHDEWLL